MHNGANSTGTELAVRDLNAWYGESHILHGMQFDVKKGEVVTLLGRNGAGKTTTMKALMGMIANRKGSVLFEGEEQHDDAAGLCPGFIQQGKRQQRRLA